MSESLQQLLVTNFGLSPSGYTGSQGTVGYVGSSGVNGYTGSAGAGGTGILISNIQVTDSSYTVLDDTAVDTAGGYIKITGSGFASGCSVLINQTAATSVTFISSTEVRAQLPATAAGTYIVYLVNTSGDVAIRVNGVTFSATPTWVTGSGLAGLTNTALSIQLSASSATTYALQAGSSLPSGVTLSNVGLISGTVTGISSETVYNFTVVATDAELQDSPRAFTLTITAGDTYFNYTTLLLSGNGTNNAQNNTFLDSGSSNLTITRNGNTNQGTFSPYGNNWSNYTTGVSGTTNRIDISSPTIGGSGVSYTMEGWFYFTAVNGVDNQNIFCTGNNVYPNRWIIDAQITSTFVRLRLVTESNSILFDGSQVSMGLNTWVHLAAVNNNSANTFTFYINGTAAGSRAAVSLTSTSAYQLFCNSSSFSGTLPFYVSNFRIVNGTAVYTSNFTPATSPLTAISGTTLLTFQSNRFKENSGSGSTLVLNGPHSIQRFSPFSPGASYSAATTGGSAYFDGTGDFLTVADNAAVNLPAGDFTIEGWFYALENSDTIINKDGLYAVAYPQYDVSLTTANKLQVQFGAGNQAATPCSTYAGTTTVPFNTWNHFAAVRTGSTIKVFLNGNQEVSTAQGAAIVAGPRTLDFAITRAQTPTHWNGYVAEFRIIKGTALYTASFTPPTTPLTAIANTSFLFSATNAGIIDSTMQNNLETVGDAKISTTQSKFGSSSMYFDGTGDYLYIPASANFGFGTGDWTIEGWIYMTDSARYNTIFDTRVGTGTQSGSFSIGIFSGGRMQLFSGGAFLYPTETFDYNTWNHFAVVKYNNVTKIYKNGTAFASTYADTRNYGSSQPIQIGNDDASNFYKGYIDDLRITRGLARYTANFTAPTAEFSTR